MTPTPLLLILLLALGVAGVAGIIYGIRCIIQDGRELTDDEPALREIEKWRNGQ